MKKKQTGRSQNHVPQAVARRISDKCSRNEVVVVVPRNGKASRVFGMDTYQKMKEQPGKHKPWQGRRRSQSIPDPLGAIDGKVRLPLTRQNFYEQEG